MKKRKEMISWIRFVDPLQRIDTTLSIEDAKKLKPSYIDITGIVIYENKESLILGERVINMNRIMGEPDTYFRQFTLITKIAIVNRKNFIVENGVGE